MVNLAELADPARYGSISTAAWRAGVSRETLLRWIRQGRVQAVKPGGGWSWIVSLESLPQKDGAR